MTLTSVDPAANRNDVGVRESSRTSMAWPAVFAGGVVAFGVAFILLALGAGIGLSIVSPYGGASASITTFTIYAAVWLIVVQWLSSALGGYVTGRLRTKWVDLRDDEIAFRDTAHGLLAWGVAVAIGVALAGIGGGSASRSAAAPDRSNYYVDQLFRSDRPSNPGLLPDAKAQANRILTISAASAKMTDGDKKYLGQLVATATGLGQADADKRVDAVIETAKSDADAARKTAARISLYVCFSLLVGAFIAAAAGALGGRHRDAQ